MAEIVNPHDRIARLFSDKLNVDAPATDVDLFEAGILDSLAFVELMLHLEREFGVTVSVDDLQIENFRSIARIADFVLSRAAVVQTASDRPAGARDRQTPLTERWGPEPVRTL